MSRDADSLLKMNAPNNTLATRHVQGFAVHVLRNDAVEIVMVPELGAKIISLKNLRTGREWLWHPQECLKLFKNRPADSFSASPLAGMDECLPTIGPCSWQGRQLPDHGEVWNQPWQTDGDAWRDGRLTTRIKLRASPFEFRRTIELAGNDVRLKYELTNLAGAEEKFLWAVHPLLRLAAGDQLELPDSSRRLLNGNTWIHAVASAVPQKHCEKVFAHPVTEGRAAITNEAQRDRLEFTWDTRENNTLGLWLTRGGWHGHHHFAIEPTNANDDFLAVAAADERCGRVAGHGTVSWQLTLRVGL